MPVLRSKKITIICTSDYVIELEDFCGKMWMHVNVMNWSPTIKRRYLTDFKKIPGPLYAVNTSRTKKLEKFILLTGWKFYERRDFGNGIEYDVYRRL